MLNEREKLGGVGKVVAAKIKDPFSVFSASNCKKIVKTSNLTGNKES